MAHTANGEGALLARVVQRLRTQARSERGTARRDMLAEPLIVLIAAGLAAVSLRDYIAPDYRAEIVPSITAMAESGWRGYIDHLPGYPAAALIESIPAKLGLLFGASEPTIWRIISAFGISVLALAVLAAVPLVRATEASRGAARVAVALAVGTPAAYWALRIGHPEELMSTGFLLGAVIAAARERPIIAGLLLGLAVGKAWPAAAALPVLGLLLPDIRRVALGIGASVVAAGAFYVPSFLFASDKIESLTNLGDSAIFNVGQVFWWFGTPVPAANIPPQVVPQPRVGPVWAGELSHPLIIGVGTAIGLIFCWTLYQRFASTPSVAALRTDGRTRSKAQAAQLASAALLVMSGILYARCFLDTWNVPYYLLPALVLGAIGELLAGRRPIITLVAAAIMWRWHAPGDLTVRSAPDVYTALYLAWTIPAGITMLALGFKAARTGLDRAPVEPPSPGAPQAALATLGDLGPLTPP